MVKKVHLAGSLRGSEPGHWRPWSLRQRACHHTACTPRVWVTVFGGLVLLLLLAQGWLLLDSSASMATARLSGAAYSRETTAAAAVDVGHMALLETLWAALPFHPSMHPAVPAHPAMPAHPEQPGAVQGSVTAGPQRSQANSSSTSTSTSTINNRLGVHKLRVPSNPELILVHRLVTTALGLGVTAQQAREAYLAAFQAVPPPRGFPAWQVKLPPTAEAAAVAEAAQQQQQHKGAHYISLEDSSDTDAGSNTTAADFVHARPSARTLNDEAAIAAAAAAATAFLARVTSSSTTTAQQQAGTVSIQRHLLKSQPQQPQSQQQQQNQTSASMEAAEHLLRYALLLMKSSHRLAPCAVDDASLPIDKLMAGHAGGAAAPPKVLLAVTGTSAKGAAQALPNLVLQLLKFVMQSQPASLYISLVDSSSQEAPTTGSGSQSSSSSTGSDGTAYWLDMLQLLMVPLQLPLLVVPGTDSTHQHGQQQPWMLDAGLQNAAVEPFFGGRSKADCSAGASVAGKLGWTSRADGSDSSSSSSSKPEQPPAKQGGSSGLGMPSSPSMQAAGDAALPQDTQAQLPNSSRSSSSSGWMSGLWSQQRGPRSLLSRGGYAFGILSPSSATAAAAAAGEDGTNTATHNPSDTTTSSSRTSSSTSNNPAALQDSVAAAIAAATASTTQHAASSSQDPSAAHSLPQCFNPDWVVFVQSSSFFCKSDLQRLLMHTDADLACGMDMHVAEPSPEPQQAAQAAAAAGAAQATQASQAASSAVAAEAITRHLLRRQQQLQQQQHNASQAAAHSIAASLAAQQTVQQHRQLLQHQTQEQPAQQVQGAAAEAAVQADSSWHERPAALDIWKHPVLFAGASVARMTNGVPFTAAPYYAAGHAPTLRRLVAGLPVQVHACWSGLTKLRSEPLARGLQFRDHAMQGECSAAGHNLLCDDLHRTGFNKVLLDAGVLLTHDLDVAVKFTPLVRAADRAPFIRRSRWVEVQGSGSPWQLDTLGGSKLQQQSYKAIQCCQLPSRPHQSGVYESGGQQQQLIVDDMVQAVAAGTRPGAPLPPLPGWDVTDCRQMDITASNHTASFLQTLGLL